MRKLAATLLGAVVLAFLWHRNYNIVGDTYDYSIVTSAGGYLHAGLKPYRDFTTPLQSLTIYLCYAAELIFGQRYLALAYMNLLLGLVFYFVLARAFRNYVPSPLGILAATAICAATFFQHGVLWYNSLAISLLMLVVLSAAIMHRRRHIDPPDFFTLCLLLYFSSMCKLNYHVLAIAMAGGILALLFFTAASGEKKKFLWVVPGALFSGLVAGPFTEVIVNRTTFDSFFYCVITTPKHRVKRLLEFLDPDILLSKVSDSFPDNWCSGVYLFALLIFSSCLYFIICRPVKPPEGNQDGNGSVSLRYFAPLVIICFYLGSMIITMTNSDIEWLTSSFLIAGLLAAFIMFAPAMSGEQTLCFKIGLFLLAGFFLVGAGASAFMHSRVRPGEAGWTKTMLEAMYKGKKLSALKNTVPFYSAEKISPDFASYFGGTRFTGLVYPRMVMIADYVKKYDLKNELQKVYWGSGLQVLNRVYTNTPSGRFPLWYHLNVTVRNEDAPAIVAAMKKNDYDWVFCTHWIVEMPDDVRNYLTNNFQSVGDDEVVIFHKK